MTTNPILNYIIESLRASNRSALELVGLGIAGDTAVRKHLKTLHDLRAIHIAAYRMAGVRNVEAVYAWGDGEDADMPDGVAKRVRSEAATLPRPVPLGAWGCVW